MRLVHRVSAIEPGGGRYGLGRIRAEADIRADDWFLTCHFVDDPVHPFPQDMIVKAITAELQSFRSGDSRLEQSCEN